MASYAAVSMVSKLASPSSPVVSNSQTFARFDGLKACPVLRLKVAQAAPVILRPSRTLSVSCAASPETVNKVVEIVTKQLATKPGVVKPEITFAALGVDSLDQVEIVMSLEEEFGITVDEDGAETIATVQDAADLVEKIKGATKAAA